VLDAAARKLAGVRAEEREIERSLVQEMASAAVSQGGTERATIFSPTASHPLSTDDRIGWKFGSCTGGQSVSFSPVRWSYQL